MPVLLSENDADSRPLTRVDIGINGAANDHESLLQKVVDDRPNILPIREFYPGVANLFSLGGEIPVETGSGQGFIDNLLVTDDGRLVLVETKLWRNPEALREVVAQTLQYGMALSQLPPAEFEKQLRRADPKWRRLGQDESVSQYVRNRVASRPLMELAEDFEDRFDEFRRAGEILLLVVGDGIRPGVERLIQWINGTFGVSPCKFGLVELCLYNLADGQRVIVPKTLLRTREASRHVVSISLQGAAREQVSVSVRGEEGETTIAPVGPLTEAGLTSLIQAKNAPEVVQVAEQLRDRLRSSGLAKRCSPAEILYGVEIEGDFISLVHLASKNVYFLIPIRAVRALGEERFVHCKRKVNSVADFYQPSTVDDASKSSILNPQYGVLKDKVGDFVEAAAGIAETIESAMAAV